MNTVSRFLRALWVAFQTTLRREPPPTPTYPAVRAWMQQAEALLTQAARATTHANLNAATIQLKVDGRATTMEAIFKTLAYHLREEYPYLLQHETEHSLMAIRSSNLNDQYRVMRLAELHEVIQTSELLEAIKALVQHLGTFPESAAATSP